ncbi:hypothetical protein J2TS4_08070 [Paenibacillus sp. J2TS4]|nr:hypothetical protein J2TS4_08070 [Paenibacillus sp. J2TS4]
MYTSRCRLRGQAASDGTIVANIIQERFITRDGERKKSLPISLSESFVSSS